MDLLGQLRLPGDLGIQEGPQELLRPARQVADALVALEGLFCSLQEFLPPGLTQGLPFRFRERGPGVEPEVAKAHSGAEAHRKEGPQAVEEVGLSFPKGRRQFSAEATRDPLERCAPWPIPQGPAPPA